MQISIETLKNNWIYLMVATLAVTISYLTFISIIDLANARISFQTTSYQTVTKGFPVDQVPSGGTIVDAAAGINITDGTANEALTATAVSTLQWDLIYNNFGLDFNMSNKIHLITPTYTRLTQMADLTKMGQTLMLVKDSAVWYVLEDSHNKSDKVARLLQRTGIPHIHAAVPQPNRTTANVFEKGGLTQRNFGLYFLRRFFEQSNASDVTGWVYFADDDNVYDFRLFDKIKRIERVGVWPVAFAGAVAVEGLNISKSHIDSEVPHVKNWVVGYWAGRSFAVDMGGFAVSLMEVLTHPTTVMRAVNLPEFTFLDDLGLKMEDAEAIAHDTDDVLIWHTKFNNPDLSGETDFKKRFGFNSYDKYNV